MNSDQATVPQNVLFDVWLLSRRTTRLLDDRLRESGLTADEFAVYSLLASGPVSPSMLAQWMAAPLTTVSSYIKRFEQRGHVGKQRDPHDARSYAVSLTAEGRRAHRRAGRLFLQVLSTFERTLGDELSDTRAAIERATAAAETLQDNAGDAGSRRR